MKDAFLKLWILCIAGTSGFAAHAIDSKHACNHRGENLAKFDFDQKRTAGSDTGAYVREVFPGKHAALRSCAEISSFVGRAIDGTTFSEMQAPVIYLLARPENGPAMEIGLEFEEITQSFRFFKGTQGHYENHPAGFDFKPGDQVCMTGFIEPDHGVFVRVEYINGKKTTAEDATPFGFSGHFGAKATWGRVIGFATRQPETHENGGFTFSRLQTIRREGFFFHGAWSGGELYDLRGPSIPISPNYQSYAYSSPTFCNYTTVWPKAIIGIKRTHDRVIFTFFPENLRR